MVQNWNPAVVCNASSLTRLMRRPPKSWTAALQTARMRIVVERCVYHRQIMAPPRAADLARAEQLAALPGAHCAGPGLADPRLSRCGQWVRERHRGVES